MPEKRKPRCIQELEKIRKPKCCTKPKIYALQKNKKKNKKTNGITENFTSIYVDCTVIESFGTVCGINTALVKLPRTIDRGISGRSFI